MEGQGVPFHLYTLSSQISAPPYGFFNESQELEINPPPPLRSSRPALVSRILDIKGGEFIPAPGGLAGGLARLRFSARSYTSTGPFWGPFFHQNPSFLQGFIRVWSKKGGPKRLKIGRPPAGLWCVLAIRNVIQDDPTPGASMKNEIGVARSSAAKHSACLSCQAASSEQAANKL